MPTTTIVVGTRTALTVSGFSTLAAGNYTASNAYDCTTNKPVDVIVEVEVATTNTPSGNKQVVVFLKESLDGTNYQSGPESGTTTTDENDLTFAVSIPVNSSSTTHRKAVSLFSAFGFIPKSFKVIPKNDLGVALTSAAIYTSEVSVVSA